MTTPERLKEIANKESNGGTMSKERLAAIKKRCEHLLIYSPRLGGMTAIKQIVHGDIPDLVAEVEILQCALKEADIEVERLQAEVERLEKLLEEKEKILEANTQS